MRIDRLLWHLRFTKTRGLAQTLAESGHVRRNGARVLRPSQPVAPGDVLAFPAGRTVRVIELLALPARRGPAAEAQACYRTLDPDGQSAIAAGQPASPGPARKESDP